MKKYNHGNAFTLVEILIGCSILALFLISAFMLFSNFRKGLSGSESSAFLLQDGSIFLARLRTDLNNAIINGNTTSLNNQLQVFPEQLVFTCYNNKTGDSLPIQYYYRKSSNGGSVFRKIGNQQENELISKTISELKWNLEFEQFKGNASGIVRIGLHVKLSLQDIKQKNKTKKFFLETRIFPARLNRQFNQL